MGKKADDSSVKDSRSRSWFAVFDNPADHGYDGEPHEICEKLKNEWVGDSATRSGAWVYCVSARGLHHVHMVLEDKKLMRWSAVKSSYAVGMHFLPTRGTKEQAEDYIYKRGKFEEKGEQILYTCIYGDIKGSQGARSDIRLLYELIKSGCSDFEIIEENPKYMMHLDKITACREMLRYEEFKNKRRLELEVSYWYGEPGTGKTSGVLDLYGDANVYMINDYRHPWDGYKGQDVVLFDDFDSSYILINDLLRWLDVYPLELPCRYNNKIACYTKVYFTSNKPFDQQYAYVQTENLPLWEAFCRRFHKIRRYTSDGFEEFVSVAEFMDFVLGRRRNSFINVSKEQYDQISMMFLAEKDKNRKED